MISKLFKKADETKSLAAKHLENSRRLLAILLIVIAALACTILLFSETNRIKDNLNEQSEALNNIVDRLEGLEDVIPLADLSGHNSSVVDLVNSSIDFHTYQVDKALPKLTETSGGSSLLSLLHSDKDWFRGKLDSMRARLHSQLMEQNQQYQAEPSIQTYQMLLQSAQDNRDYLENQRVEFNDIVNGMPMLLLSLNAILFLMAAYLVYLVWFQNIQPMVHKLEMRNDELFERASELDHMAHNDTLTGTKNRQFFHQSLNAMITDNFGKLPFSLIRVDINKFRVVNESYGQTAGDQVLQSISQLLVGYFPGSRVARTAPDEFSIIDERIDAKELEEIIREITRQANIPLKYNGHEIRRQVSIGVAIYPQDAKNLTNLLRHTSYALSAAKQRHGSESSYLFYNDMGKVAAEVIVPTYQDYLKAFEKGEFVVYYSPQFSLETLEVIGAEALLRWNHPRFSKVNVEHMITAAEQMGLIARITEVVLSEVESFYNEVIKRWNKDYKLGLNFSGGAAEIEQEITSAAAMLSRNQRLAQNLVVEITEKVIFGARGEELSDKLEPLRELGCKISLDDFGTGFASLVHLMDVKFDSLKIDRSFVKDMLTSDTAHKIVKSMLSLAQALNKEVVAEGIETLEDVEALRALGCVDGQGYFISKPLSRDDFMQMLQAQNASIETSRLSAV